MSKQFPYIKNPSEKDSPKMSILRNKLLSAIKKDASNVNDLIKEFEELKEKEFVAKHGMSSEEYAIKLEEEIYISETLEIRVCMCYKCNAIFESDRLYPTCSACNCMYSDALEEKKDSKIIGKQIKNVFSNEEQTVIIFTDGSSEKFSHGYYC